MSSPDNYLAHYGTKRHSGRYPWGSGGDVRARSRDFMADIEHLKNQGFSEAEIRAAFEMNSTQYRAAKSVARNAIKQDQIRTAQKLSEKGWANTAIAEHMFGSRTKESTVRALLEDGAADKADILTGISDMLRRQVDERGLIDIGAGVERHIGVSPERLRTAVSILEREGYVVHKVQVDQLTSPNKTTIRVLAPPGTTYTDVKTNRDQIKGINEWSVDGGRTGGWLGIDAPLPVSASRVAVKYAEDGGKNADGVIYVRPGVKDLSLGGNHYAQVRIVVNGTHYLKGMAIHHDDMPPGVDLVFNTNKSKADLGTNKLAAMKPLKKVKVDGKETDEIDWENPFGSVVRQLKDENKKVVSAMNIVNEAGDWESWSKSLSSQFLSKQSPKLAKKQLDLAYEVRKRELDTIMSLTNPVIKKKLLETFAENADSASITLKAHALPRQENKVILPINSLKDTEVYAPTLKQGDRVVLVRHPHGGIFEIPELVVNNRNVEAKKVIGPSTRDAIGINSKVADRLSGADFDGDTVLVIPNTVAGIKTKAPLEKLADFDPQHEYPYYDGMPVMSAKAKQQQMGEISNLITDMTIKGASYDELARAVRHSMVVIDAEKHKLDYKRSAEENGILALKKKYQLSEETGRAGGASTLISRAKSRADVPKYVERGIDPVTGEKIKIPTNESYVDRNTGRTIYKTTRTTKLAAVKDAHELSSGTPIEAVYADYSNRVRDLANTARREGLHTPNLKKNASAEKTYADEVASLDYKLDVALRNSPKERQALVLANTILAQKKAANPDMDAAELKKLKGMAMQEARLRMGAKKELVEITDGEWEAIQAGAISHTKLTDILNNTDVEKVKQLATPRTQLLMTSAKTARARDMQSRGYTLGEIANALGVSLTTLKTSLD